MKAVWGEIWRSSIWFHLPSFSFHRPVLSVLLPANSSPVTLSTNSTMREQKHTHIPDCVWRGRRRGLFFSAPSDTQDTFFKICLFKECRASTYALFHRLHLFDIEPPSLQQHGTYAEKDYCTFTAPVWTYQVQDFNCWLCMIFYASACRMHKSWSFPSVRGYIWTDGTITRQVWHLNNQKCRVVLLSYFICSNEIKKKRVQMSFSHDFWFFCAVDNDDVKSYFNRED